MTADKLIQKAVSLSKKGETEKALALFRQVLVKYPSNKRAQNGISKLFANADYKQVPHPPKVVIDEIIDCQRRSEFLLAIKKSEHWLEGFPYSFFMWNLLGVLYKNIGEKKKSKRDLFVLLQFLIMIKKLRVYLEKLKERFHQFQKVEKALGMIQYLSQKIKKKLLVN